jgi:hypothetical protein
VVGDLTIRRVQRDFSGRGRPHPPTESIEYLKADRRREERRGWVGYRLWSHGRTIYRPGPRTASIARCDLKQRFLLNLEDREYAAWPFQAFPSKEEWLADARASGQAVLAQPREPNILVETETTDTGERRDIFGHPARHVIVTRRIIPLAGAKGGPSTTVSDGWYIDLDTRISCDPWWRSVRSGHAFVTGHIKGEQPDVPAFNDVGDPERGFLLRGKSTSSDTARLQDGSMTERVSTSESEVTELSTATLDPALFEVPTDFRLVERIRQDPIAPLAIRWKRRYDRLIRRVRR